MSDLGYLTCSIKATPLHAGPVQQKVVLYPKGSAGLPKATLMQSDSFLHQGVPHSSNRLQLCTPEQYEGSWETLRPLSPAQLDNGKQVGPSSI